MELLRRELLHREVLIKRGAYLMKVAFGPVRDQVFTGQFWWRGGDMSKTFTYRDYFGHSGTERPRLLKKPCRIKQDLIREILTRRGI